MSDIVINATPRFRQMSNRIWLERAVWRQDWRCHWCRGPVWKRRGLEPTRKSRDNCPTLDHIIPLCRGGEDSEENTVMACWLCNNRKGSMMPWDFAAMLAEERAEFPWLSKEGVGDASA